MDTLRIATIGTSAICERFCDAVSHTGGVSLIACYSRDGARARAWADRHGAPLAFCDLDELAASPEVDAVYVASPNGIHARQAEVLLQAGKHVLCEKSLASNEDEARRIFQVAEGHGTVLLEAMRNLHTLGLSVAESTLPRMGNVQAATFRFAKITSRMRRLRAGERINMFDPYLSEGSLMDMGVYAVEPAVTLFGRPQRVHAVGVTMPVPGEPAGSRYGTIDLLGELLLDYDDKTVNVSYGKTYDNIIPSQIQGDLATLTIDNLATFSGLRLYVHEGSAMIYTAPEAAGIVLPTPTPDNDMVCELGLFRDAVQGETEALDRVSRFRTVTLDALAVMDEARRQMGVRFPADEAS